MGTIRQIIALSVCIYAHTSVYVFVITQIWLSDVHNHTGYLWMYLVPQWLDDILEQVMTKWRNILLFLTYGEDFTHPPPLEIDETAVHPVRTAEEEAARFHPKHGFQARRLGASLPPLPSVSPSRKARRKDQRQQQQHNNKEQARRIQQEGGESSAAASSPGTAGPGSSAGLEASDSSSVSVLDPTWGVLSVEVQSRWREEEARREQQRQRAVRAAQRGGGRPLPPVRLSASSGGGSSRSSSSGEKHH